MLLIAHEGSRSGAPILLLTFARWLSAHTDARFEVLLLRNGPLRSDFARLAPTMVLDELSGRAHPIGRALNRLRKMQDHQWHARAFRKLLARQYTVVFGNSIVCLPWLKMFKAATTARCVCAVHELTWTIGRFFDKPYVEQVLPTMDRVVAGSHAVRNNLISTYGTPPGLVEVIHSFVTQNLAIRRDSATLRNELGIAAEETVIGAIGTAELRKGIDLFIPIAAALCARDPQRRFRFVWLGGRPGDELVSLCQRDAQLLGLEGQVVFVDVDPDANDYVNLFDVFLLPSREDPFPLVVLTAIRMGKPVVAFQRSGGMDELLVDGAGRLVPYLDVDRFAEAIDEVLTEREATARMTARALAKVTADYGVDKLAQRLHEAIAPPPVGTPGMNGSAAT